MSAYATHGGHKKYCHVLSNRGKYLHLYINIYLTNRKACVKVIDLTVKLLRRNIDKTDLVWTGSNLRQQISKFYPQILSTEASFYIIYDRPLTDINVIASVCALNLRIKF